MTKKKLWIIIGSVLAVCLIAAAIIIYFAIDNGQKDPNPNGAGSQGDKEDSGQSSDRDDQNDGDDDTKYEVKVRGKAALLSVGQTAKIVSEGSYSSADTAVATVDASGIVTAVGVGHTKITSLATDGTTSEYDIFVSKTVNSEKYTAPEGGDPALVCTSNSVTAGEYVELSICLANDPGVSAFSFVVSYDSELLTFEAASAFGEMASVQFADDGKGTVHIIGISYEGDSFDKTDAGDGLVRLYFMAKSDAPAVTSAVSLSMGEGDMLVQFVNGTEKIVAAKLHNGSVQITK